MHPEQKCVSLETAKKLKEAGFDGETERYWVPVYGVGDEVEEWKIYPNRQFSDWEKHPIFPAPDAQEIGELLTSKVMRFRFFREFMHDEFEEEIRCWWIVRVYSSSEHPNNPKCRVGSNSRRFSVRHENEAEARAKCWLWLRENDRL